MSDTQNELNELQNNIAKLKQKIESVGKRLQGNETGTRTSFINPFLEYLGYDSRNPLEVVPEYTADVGSRRGEKVDYAVMLDDKPIILIEAKPLGANLRTEQASQLRRYYHVTDAKIGLLTDGRIYHFFLDTTRKNVMDEDPFFTLDVCDTNESEIGVLFGYSKSQISDTLGGIDRQANVLKNKSQIKEILAKEIESPSNDFAEFWLRQISPKARATTNKLNDTKEVVRVAVKEFIDEKVVALFNEATDVARQKNKPEATKKATSSSTGEYFSTEHEKNAFAVIKGILASAGCDQTQLYSRAMKSVTQCLWDNSIRCKVVTLHLRGAGGSGWAEIADVGRVELNNPYDLHKHSDKIVAAFNSFG